MKRERITLRKGREAAIQLLCAIETKGFSSDCSDEEMIFWQIRPTTAPARAFAETLITGVRTHITEIDRQLVAHLKNFQLTRLALVDRNILRLALYEILERHDTPPIVAINEAIEVAKKFSTSESAPFINGVLDGIAQTIGRPLRQATATRQPQPPPPEPQAAP